MLHLLQLLNEATPSGAPRWQQPEIKHASAVKVRIDGATPGCYSIQTTDVEYHTQLDGISSTGMKQLLRSPSHYQQYVSTRGGDDTNARRFGRAVHAYVLERSTYESRHVIWKGGDRRQAGYKDFEFCNPGKTILTVEEQERVEGAAHALLSCPDFPLRGFLEGARDDAGQVLVPQAATEFTIIWTDEETGVICRIRVDAFAQAPALIAVDLKTCGDARPDAFDRDIASMDYDLSAALYLEGLRRYTGKQGVFILAAVEAKPPHGVCFHALGRDHDFILNGTRKYRDALRIYAQCKATNKWPGYGFNGVVEPRMAHYMEYRTRTDAMALAA